MIPAAVCYILLSISAFIRSAAFTAQPLTSVSDAGRNPKSMYFGATAATETEVQAQPQEILFVEELGATDISSLSFRQLQRQCKARGLEVAGTTGALRMRLAEVLCPPNDSDCVVVSSSDEKELFSKGSGISFDSEDFDARIKRLEMEIQQKCKIGHWKSAVRKLKLLSSVMKEFSGEKISAQIYEQVLAACAADRLAGARASVSARKIMEEMADSGYSIPSDTANACIIDSLSGKGPDATHDGFGGIDVALAMLSAMESSGTPVKEATFNQLINALITNTNSPRLDDDNNVGNTEEAISLIRSMVVQHNITPSLAVYASVAEKVLSMRDVQPAKQVDLVLQLLTYTKAAGYELDSIASAADGRALLADGVIVAERVNNLALGLRLLTAAMKAQGCAPERGDQLVATLSKASQRASALLHIRSIDMAVKEDNWKLAVRLLQLMPERSLLAPSNVWRKVVTVCAKNEKSRKAAQLLFDWVQQYEEQRYNNLYSSSNKLQKPPLSVFNTVINTCEICGEEELTLKVLDSMKQTHETEGNIITFNIALKRLAKLGNSKACEGIIIGMLNAGTEPNVVSYTTAIGACANAKDSAFAYTWLERMRSRNVQPNLFSYNTALSACLDGKLESTIRGSKIAAEMMADLEKELASKNKLSPSATALLPDSYTKVLARNLMKQLRENWRSGEIDMAKAKATIRVPLLKLVDFDMLQEAQKVLKNKTLVTVKVEDPNCYEESSVDEECSMHEVELEYAVVQKIHRTGARVAEV